MDWVRFGTFPLRRKLVDFDAEAPFSGEAVVRPFGARLEARVVLGEEMSALEVGTSAVCSWGVAPAGGESASEIGVVCSGTGCSATDSGLL